jgi:hypothetical protein
MIARVRASKAPPDAAWLVGEWDVTTQAALCDGICKELGFDTSAGRLDVSVHPFTGGAGPTDVRMTTRFKAHDLTEGLTGAVHECGHALYEQGRNLSDAFQGALHHTCMCCVHSLSDALQGALIKHACTACAERAQRRCVHVRSIARASAACAERTRMHAGLPANEALSLGVHESQSLLWERMVALSPAFCEYLLPRIQAKFPTFGEGKTAQVRFPRLQDASSLTCQLAPVHSHTCQLAPLHSYTCQLAPELLPTLGCPLPHACCPALPHSLPCMRIGQWHQSTLRPPWLQTARWHPCTGAASTADLASLVAHAPL